MVIDLRRGRSSGSIRASTDVNTSPEKCAEKAGDDT
jgi:hypothetical protein